MVDHAPEEDGASVSVFESGAILLYLADKTRQFMPQNLRGRIACTEWLFWQVAGLGPMAGQNHHFNPYAPEKTPYAIERYVRETSRLYGVLNKRLEAREFICGDAYTIADMACYPWIMAHEVQQQRLEDFAHLKRWLEAIQARPAALRAYAKGAGLSQPDALLSAEARRHLFGQGKMV